MAPVVHGLEKKYSGRVQFLYLDTSDPRTENAREKLGFDATPHFFYAGTAGSLQTSRASYLKTVSRGLWTVCCKPQRFSPESRTS